MKISIIYAPTPGIKEEGTSENEKNNYIIDYLCNKNNKVKFF